MNLNVRQIPVFAFPTSLKFYLGTKSSHTQVLTLYSPYDFPIKYKVHCHSSAWDKYVVPTPEGTIPGQSTIDLVITHKHVVPVNCNISDKLKIVIQDPETDQIIGRKTIEAILLPGERDSSRAPTEDDFSEVQSHEGSVQGTASIIRSAPYFAHSASRSAGNNLVFGGIVAVCAVLLFLPTEVDVTKPSNLPSYLHVSHKVQIFAAMVLGAFLCVLVRS
ncbi:motile sperm domain-containing protein 1-like [Euwallacea fornicatus]|uniref:motile sperm domain-containing protein 1-like n=1 Tax=Euwallacea fornicatus TaxID=995702 RepID=UPI00338D8567